MAHRHPTRPLPHRPRAQHMGPDHIGSGLLHPARDTKHSAGVARVIGTFPTQHFQLLANITLSPDHIGSGLLHPARDTKYAAWVAFAIGTSTPQLLTNNTLSMGPIVVVLFLWCVSMCDLFLFLQRVPSIAPCSRYQIRCLVCSRYRYVHTPTLNQYNSEHGPDRCSGRVSVCDLFLFLQRA